MKRSDLTVVAGLGIVALLIGFYVMVLAPKRQEASDLQQQVSDLQASVQQQQQLADFAQQAKAGFGQNYHRLVVLGKAVPQESDQASLLVQLNTLAQRAGVSFRTLDLSSTGVTTPAITTPPLLQPGTPSSGSSTTPTDGTTTAAPAAGSTTAGTSGSSATAPTGASTSPTGQPASIATPLPLPTETTAALTPLGSGIGPAGLPVMPYDLSFSGGFFQVADFLHELDALVHSRHGKVVVSGRLLTVNGFTLSPTQVDPTSASTTGATTASGNLTVKLSVTTYLTPADQGLTGGASPSGPVTASAATSVPAAATTPTPATTP